MKNNMIWSKAESKYIIQEFKSREIFNRITGHYPNEKIEIIAKKKEDTNR